MTKRFTDSSKWRNEWFRTLPIKAKMAWVYLCDECDFSGVWKSDCGLASFQLDFKITKNDLSDWFGDKIHFFDNDKVLIVQFFEFQYGQSKDSWTAKIKAKERLEALGFTLENGKVEINKTHTPTTVGGQYHDSGTSVLIVGVGVGVGEVSFEKEGVGEKTLEAAFFKYPLKNKGSNAQKRFKDQIKTDNDYADLIKSIDNYLKYLKIESWRRPKQSWETFLGTKDSGYFWRQWIDWSPTIDNKNSTTKDHILNLLNENGKGVA